ncbi:TrmH family RNA methyltransferase [Zunongwangia sp.]|uniref:TrmH family RNA methyltransferase n=1 Tax=Zunongwangia sp. TaxID=1965325 RepID=UPI003AA8A607
MTDHSLIEYLRTFLTDSRKQLFDHVLKERTNHFTVATQDVFQLHNTSAVIRSCDVFGIQNVHIIEERLTKQIEREIAMGAQKWVTINRYQSTKSCISNLREKGYQIVATSPHTNSVTLEDFNVSKPSVFFFGTEKEGLSEEILKEADCSLKIPMYGFTESLNISVSAAIVLQHVTQKMRTTPNVHWELSPEELDDLQLEWLRKSIKNIDQIILRFANKN